MFYIQLFKENLAFLVYASYLNCDSKMKEWIPPFCQKQMQDVKTVWQWVVSGTLVYPGLGIHTSILKLTLVLKAAGYKLQLQAHHWHKYVNNNPFQGAQVSLKLP